MPQLRLNIATGDWVVLAPERARRPEDFRREPLDRALPHLSMRPDCPFCPGNEVNTPGESLRYCDEDGLWQVRAFPNRYPAMVPGEPPQRQGDGMHRWLEGIGCHEVVAESRLHNFHLSLASLPQATMILKAWRERYRTLAAQPGIEHVILFKNYGRGAGTSLEHPHSQVVGLPVVPNQVWTRLDVASRYYHEHGVCVFCRMAEEERQEGVRLVHDNASFTAFVPYASFSPFSIWIVPHQHRPSFSQTSDQELGDLAELLLWILRRFYHALGDPDYNLVVRSSHPDALGKRLFHWYLALVPRLGKLAGFEMGTGMFINASLPEADARFLRELEVPS